MTKKEFAAKFTAEEMENPITRQSVVEKLIQMDMLEKYPLGIPENLIRYDNCKVQVRNIN